MMLILSAVAADLFTTTTDSWIYNSLKNIENSNGTPTEKMNLIKFYLSQAVSRHYSIFMEVNGFESTLKKLVANIGKIMRGSITIKELIVLVLYALYDLILKGGLLGFNNPTDIMVLFGGIVILKIIDAKTGFPLLIANMYKEAHEEREVGQNLIIMENFIKQLGHFFIIEQDKVETPELRLKNIVEELNVLIPKVDPEKIKLM